MQCVLNGWANTVWSILALLNWRKYNIYQQFEFILGESCYYLILAERKFLGRFKWQPSNHITALPMDYLVGHSIPSKEPWRKFVSFCLHIKVPLKPKPIIGLLCNWKINTSINGKYTKKCQEEKWKNILCTALRILEYIIWILCMD